MFDSNVTNEDFKVYNIDYNGKGKLKSLNIFFLWQMDQQIWISKTKDRTMF